MSGARGWFHSNYERLPDDADEPGQYETRLPDHTDDAMPTGILVNPQRWGKNARLIEQWNKAVPIGSHVLYWPGEREGEGRESVTRSAAWLLGGHTPVVMVEGYAGGIALTHVMGYAWETDQ